MLSAARGWLYLALVLLVVKDGLFAHVSVITIMSVRGVHTQHVCGKGVYTTTTAAAAAAAAAYLRTATHYL